MSPTKRRRGAPLGNRNAVTHGFYSRLPHVGELTGLANPQLEPAGDVDQQIAVIQHYMQRVSELGQDSQDLSQLISLLRGLCVASNRLGNLRRRQALLAMLNTNKDQIEQLFQSIKASMEQGK